MTALRSDRALQRCVQQEMDEAIDQLSRNALWSRVMDDLETYGNGAEIESLPALSRLLSDAEHANEWIAHWVRSLASGLTRNPMGQIPFRHSYSPGLVTMQLAAHGRAVISLVVYESAKQRASAKSALFVDREQTDLVIAGHAQADLFSHDPASPACLDPAPVKTVRREIGPGSVIDTSGGHCARRFNGVKDCLVLLQLARMPNDPLPSREIQLNDGALLRQSSGDKRASQHEMAMALLGAMGRIDAAPVMAEMTGEGPDHMRWEALRQSLHLDAAQGFAALRRLAGDGCEPLSGSARALQRSLEQSYPELAQLENVA